MVDVTHKKKRYSRHISIVLLLVVASVIANPPAISEKLLRQVSDLYGRSARERLLDWQALMDSHDTDTEENKLRLVNDFFNGMRFVSDIDHWGKEDYWATPVEFLASKGGDCEDYSIAKYYTLKQMGVPIERMRITYVKALELNQAHMVLTYYSTPDSIPLVLDNLKSKILPATERSDLLPVYSFNAEGLWLAKSRTEGLKVGKAKRVGLWDDLVMRINTEMVNKSK